ncbi:MAG: hypothetical protein JW776_06030 [Candidatus Lokiarchaeota archaeon]|nr:hypothetical protein [Candidatus Lokiarchaeota archaeon]
MRKNYKLSQLEKMGKIKIKKKPTFVHSHSQAEYDEKIEELTSLLNQIKKIDIKVNQVQQRILNICIKKLCEVLKYYFNTYTYKQNLQKDRIFRKYIKELQNFKSKYFNTNKADQQLIDEVIDTLTQEFLSQREYIKQLEEEIKEEKINPYTEKIEILDNSLKRNNILE